jgi:alkylation response protein AidB-like acyl-CoA dehydrogenase
MLGMRGYATCEIVFNDCYVPKENLLGIHGQGRKVALSSLAKGRVTIAAQATGWAQGALEALIGCLNGKNFSVLDFQNSVVSSSSAVEQEHFQFEATSTEYILGEMVVNIESARALTYQAASSIDRGDNDVTLASMAKVQATDVAMNVSTKALAMAGFAGLQPELLLERYFRDSKAGQIYEGTNQIQRLLIARNLLR